MLIQVTVFVRDPEGHSDFPLDLPADGLPSLLSNQHNPELTISGGTSRRAVDVSNNLCRATWKNFLIGCIAVVEDARQIFANNQQVFTNAQAPIVLDVTRFTAPPPRMDVWQGNNFPIPTTLVTNTLFKEDLAKVHVESMARPGIVTRRLTRGFAANQINQVDRTRRPVGLNRDHPNADLEDLITKSNNRLQDQVQYKAKVYTQTELNNLPNPAGQPFWNYISTAPAATRPLRFHRSVNGGPVRQAPTDHGLFGREVIGDLMLTWGTPNCPQPAEQIRQRYAVPLEDPSRIPIDPVNATCGPHVKFYRPDVILVATEDYQNIKPSPGPDVPQPNNNLIPREAASPWKVPYLVMEIAGQKDEWSSKNAKSKLIIESTYALQFFPYVYSILVWKTEISIFKISRNVARKRLDIIEERLDLNPDSTTQAPPTNVHEFLQGLPLPNGQLGPAGPPSTDLSRKFQYLACKIVNIVLEMSSLQDVFDEACNNLRYPHEAVPQSDMWLHDGYANVANQPAFVQDLPPPPRAYGFRPVKEQLMWQMPGVAVDNNPRPHPGNAANLRPPEALDEEENSMNIRSYVDPQNLRKQEKCWADGASTGCKHISSRRELRRLIANKMNGTVVYRRIQ